MLKILLTPLLILVLATNTIAQEPQNDKNKNQKKENNKHGVYIKGGLAHWQENIFSDDSLIDWENNNLFGTGYNLTSVSAEIETYFKNNHILLSGWSIGYRKDALRYSDFGHMFYARGFRNFNLKIFELKPSGGIEWGMPTLNFDKTYFNYLPNGSLNYTHIYPVKNSNVPSIGTSKDGAYYPFVELSIVKRPKIFLIEGGMRVNIIKFGISNYSVSPDDKIEYTFIDRKVIAPYLFINLGIKMF